MTWYTWKWWRFAWACNKGKPGRVEQEMGYKWMYLIGHLIFLVASWRVISTKINSSDLEQIKPGRQDLIDKCFNDHLVAAGADPYYGKRSVYYDGMTETYHLFWEDI